MTKINPQIIDDYYLVDSQEVELWKNSIFVFDTSALLQFYYYSDKAKNNIFETTFKPLKGRLWIPFHVGYEYLKNREPAIKKSYSEKYDPLEKGNLQNIQNIIDSIGTELDDIQNRTKSTDTHPFFVHAEIIGDFKNKLEKFKIGFQEFERKAKQEFETRKEEINLMLNNDTVLISVEKYFDRGDAYSFEKIMEVVAEGEVRYRNTIPPGYKDTSDKKGTQKYGDLIIWKQIIDYAEKTRKPIVLVTNDVKDDWVYAAKHDKEVRIERPREELIKEIKDHANVAFWMYTFSQFLYQAKERLNYQVDNTVLEEVKQMNIFKESTSPLSAREMEVIELVTRGSSNKQIAYNLEISHQTVKNHMTSILRKFGVEDRTQAVVYALQNGWVRLPDPDDEEE